MQRLFRHMAHVLHIQIFLLLHCSLLLLSACTSVVQEAETKASSPLVYLIESTHIIRNLIATNRIAKLLVDHDPEDLDCLLDNVSPAEIAFEVEVLSSTIPLVFVCYMDENQSNAEYIDILQELAIQYDNQIKIVIIDAAKLILLAADADIESVPSLLIVQDREVVERIEGFLSKEQIEQICIQFVN